MKWRRIGLCIRQDGVIQINDLSVVAWHSEFNINAPPAKASARRPVHEPATEYD
jgi:hypothetical protein